MSAEQPGLAVAQQHVAFSQLGAARPQRLDLPAFQHQAGLEALLDSVVKARLFVPGDAGIGRFGGFFGHGRAMILEFSAERHGVAR